MANPSSPARAASLQSSSAEVFQPPFSSPDLGLIPEDLSPPVTATELNTSKVVCWLPGMWFRCSQGQPVPVGSSQYKHSAPAFQAFIGGKAKHCTFWSALFLKDKRPSPCPEHNPARPQESYEEHTEVPALWVHHRHPRHFAFDGSLSLPAAPQKITRSF